MKFIKPFSILCLFLLLSCDDDTVPAISDQTVIGSWTSEVIYLNGVNSNVYVDFLNEGTFFSITEDGRFSRNYISGNWAVSNRRLYLMADFLEPAERTYDIIGYSDDKLIIQTKLKESEYCCDFPDFDSESVITIKEVFRRVPSN